MSKTVLIIQARMGSTRLPGKSMFDLAGAPLVGRILERVKRCKRVDEIILAIPDTPQNRPLADLATTYDVKFFRGSEDDVLGRYYHAAKQFSADLIVRLPADNPTPEPTEIDRIISHHYSLARKGFSSNLTSFAGNCYPDGIGAEIFDFELLEYAYKSASYPRLREHLHLNFIDYDNSSAVNNMFPISTVSCPHSFARPELVLDVNTYTQYEFIRSLYEALYPQNPSFHITDILKWYDNVYLNK